MAFQAPPFSSRQVTEREFGSYAMLSHGTRRLHRGASNDGAIAGTSRLAATLFQETLPFTAFQRSSRAALYIAGPQTSACEVAVWTAGKVVAAPSYEHEPPLLDVQASTVAILQIDLGRRAPRISPICLSALSPQNRTFHHRRVRVCGVMRRARTQF